MLSVQLEDKFNHILFESTDEQEVCLYFKRAYEEGDRILIRGGKHIVAQMDLGLPEGEVYTPNECMTWTVPYGEHRLAYCPNIFDRLEHVVRVRQMTSEEIHSIRCISRNPADLRGNIDFYPHAIANVETRDESCFAARNILDGFTCNTDHGYWPYQSWGIGIRNDACCEIDLGRSVLLNRIAVILRADFPHDAWWQSATIRFDDNKEMALPLNKTKTRQFYIPEETQICRKIKIYNLIKADDPSPFPALTQFEVYGKDLI